MENVSVGSNSKKFQTSNFYSLTMIELYESRISNHEYNKNEIQTTHKFESRQKLIGRTR